MICNKFCGNNLLFIIMFLEELNAVRAEDKRRNRKQLQHYIIIFYYCYLLYSDHRQKLRTVSSMQISYGRQKMSKASTGMVRSIEIKNNQASF